MSGLISHPVFIGATWIAAIFGGIGIGAAFVSAIVGYQLTEEALSDANTKISVAREEARIAIEKEANQANKAIAEARAETAKAVADTAKANERTADLKLALEREIAARQPRTISAEAKAQIVALLKNDRASKGRVVVLWKLFDEEAEQFAKQIIDVLKDGGFDAVEGAGPLSFSARGAWIIFRDFKTATTTPSALGTVQAAFRNVLHIELDGQPRTEGFPDEDAVIAIGPKPF